MGIFLHSYFDIQLYYNTTVTSPFSYFEKRDFRTFEGIDLPPSFPLRLWTSQSHHFFSVVAYITWSLARTVFIFLPSIVSYRFY